MRIEVAQCKEGYMAWIVQDAEKYGIGESPKAAIGDLVTKYPRLFNIEGLANLA